MNGARRLLVFVNARARGGEGAGDGEAFEAKLQQAGFAVTFERIESPEQLDATVLRLAPDHDAIVIGGGDGSMRAALPAILKANLPVAIWPLGTANDFTRSLGIECEDDCLHALRDWSNVGSILPRSTVNPFSTMRRSDFLQRRRGTLRPT
ncbi:MAG TPA: diacylglycerol kinase family protein [Candidatus Tyrphobacter sp.]